MLVGDKHSSLSDQIINDEGGKSFIKLTPVPLPFVVVVKIKKSCEKKTFLHKEGNAWFLLRSF
jgi:hypothetical protein